MANKKSPSPLASFRGVGGADSLFEAGCDEAGRGCLAGSVYAAAVVFPKDYENEALNDSKQLTDKRRKQLREIIERDAIAWAIGIVTAEEIDKINILNASILAMHRALDQVCEQLNALSKTPERLPSPFPSSLPASSLPSSSLPASPVSLSPFPASSLPGLQGIIIDGNRFKPYRNIPYETIVKGDGKYLSIAAASILAKTYRDDYMDEMAEKYPYYEWQKNKGYPTKAHRRGIMEHGFSPIHRMTFRALPEAVEQELPFE